MSSGQDGLFRQTALHLAVAGGHSGTIRAILQGSAKSRPNLNLKNSSGQTVLGLALASEMEDVAAELLRCELHYLDELLSITDP